VAVGLGLGVPEVFGAGGEGVGEAATTGDGAGAAAGLEAGAGFVARVGGVCVSALALAAGAASRGACFPPFVEVEGTSSAAGLQYGDEHHVKDKRTPRTAGAAWSLLSEVETTRLRRGAGR
jgi:hypothetical protein